jgi:Gas vesicle protein G
MGLLSSLVGWPLAPVRGVIAVARLVQRQAEQELYEPNAVRQQLEETQAAADAGLISRDEADRRSEQLLRRLTAARVRPGDERG